MAVKKRPRLKPAPALDQARILQAALELLEAVGFDGLTMRMLAARLGIQAASLYWHIRSKQELLALMANEICAPMHAPDQSLSWQKQLRVLGVEYRQVLLGRRDAARVLAASGAPSGPNLLRLSEIVLSILLGARFSHRDAAYAGSLVNDYVVMFVLEEIRYAGDSASHSPSGSADWLKALPRAQYPSLTALARYLVSFDADERFQFGMEVLIKGLEARLAQSKA